MYNILIVYRSITYPLRVTIADHLYSFQRYAPHRCFYLNLALRRFPAWLLRVPFDLVVFHTTFLSQRAWNPSKFHQMVELLHPLKSLEAVKIALPQDEFLNTDLLGDFINEFGVQHVFSVAPASEWPKIYGSVDSQRVTFFNVLTGYLDDKTVAKINNLDRSIQTRSVDIGYRAYGVRHWLGRHGFLKIQMATFFQEKVSQGRLVTDISTRSEDTFLGDEWYKFLLQCKYTLGVEGGASILDRDGSIRKRTEDYLQQHPQAGFEEVESQCFPGLDGSLRLFAISPRHLEACATRTCQVLVEGEYNGILRPGQHYIELARDLSNVDQVLETIELDTARAEIIERAYRDVVESGRYTYQKFVEFVLGKSLEGTLPKPSPAWVVLAWRWGQLSDWRSWAQIPSHPLYGFFRSAFGLLAPARLILRLCKRVMQ
ncbi:MAG: hypothetical protein JW850_02145 [Thermoflexales bacterium]|nr:hypothetical protein [Thermoflexales bacterium]